MKLGFGAVAATGIVGLLFVMEELIAGGTQPWQWWSFAALAYLAIGFLLAEGGRTSANAPTRKDYGGLAYGIVFLLWPLILTWVLLDRRKRNQIDDDPDAYDHENDDPRDYDDAGDGSGPGPSVRGGTYRGHPVDRS